MTSTVDEYRQDPIVPVENALTVTGLRAGYGRTEVLRDLSLTVPAGQVTALLGPNGAGKSTLLRTICGYIPASAGKVTLFGQDVTKQTPHRRFAQGLCHIPEGRGVFRGLTVRENLAMQGGRGREKHAIERAAAAFPILRKRLNQTAGTLSGGEQQMLAMSAAYVRDRKIVLVDEASLGLAPIVVDEIFEFLHRLTAEGGSLLLVDQFATRALSMAKSVYIMRRGKISYSGDAQSLLDGDVFAHYVSDLTGADRTHAS